MYYGFGIVLAKTIPVELLKFGTIQVSPCLIVEGELGMLCAKIEDDSMSTATRKSMSLYRRYCVKL